MIDAFVLIQVRPGSTEAAVAEVAAVKGVTSADGVAGPYDVIARAKAANLDELANLVVMGIQACSGVSRTLVCVIPGSEVGS